MALERRFGRALTAHFLEEYRKVLKAASNGNYHHPSDEELAQVMRPYLFDAANMGADAAEKPLLAMGLGFDTALTNEVAVAAAREYSYALVRGINDTTRAALQKHVSEYIAQPTQIDDLGKKLAATFGKKRAGVIATTETTRAYATAQEVTWKEVNRQYGATIISGMQWLTANDEIVCPICAPLGGLVFDASTDEAIPQDEDTQEANARVKPIGGTFTHPGGAGMAARFAGGEYDRPPAHPNCILPGNEIVLPGTLAAASKAFYEGIGIEIRLADGRRLTVTENHPILTPGGFVAAKFLHHGDYVVSSSDAQRIAATINPNDEHGPTAIEQIFDTLAKSSEMMAVAVPSSAEDFHGDGRSVYGNIDIVYPHRLLLDDDNILLLQPVSQQGFGRYDMQPLPLSGNGTSHLGFESVGVAASGNMGGFDLLDSLLGSHTRPFDSFGFALIPEQYTLGAQTPNDSSTAYSVGKGNGIRRFATQIAGGNVGRVERERVRAHGDAMLDKVLAQGGVTHTAFSRQFTKRFASLIAGDQIVGINRFWVSGHVYDLSLLEYELYICNGVIVKNCRCSLQPWVEEIPNA